jgi:hypothetical protein
MSVLIVREIHVIIMLVYTLDQYRRMATVNQDPVQKIMLACAYGIMDATYPSGMLGPIALI